ncbi:MAG: LytR/AlgR family response regulator transcription factor [Bacteroidia bacterium]
MSEIRILIVEDDPIIAMDIAANLEDMGYLPLEDINNGPEAVTQVMKEEPDLVLLDINLKGEWDGIETAGRLRRMADLPIIFLTALSDRDTVDRAKLVEPDAFLVKPFQKRELQIAIEMALYRYSKAVSPDNEVLLKDAIFIKEKNGLTKIMIEDILWVEAENSYAKLVTKSKEVLLSSNLGSISENLRAHSFARIHRSFMINLKHLDGIQENMVIIGDKSIPISKNYHKPLLEYLNRL